MESIVEVVRVLAGLTTEQLGFWLAFGALAVSALAVYALASVVKKDR